MDISDDLFSESLSEAGGSGSALPLPLQPCDSWMVVIKLKKNQTFLDIAQGFWVDFVIIGSVCFLQVFE